MKKFVVIVVLILCCIGIGVGAYYIKNKGVDDGANKAILYIKQTSWSGLTTQEQWEAEKKANEEKEADKVEVYEGKVIKYNGGVSDNFEIEITSVSNDKIIIKVNEGMCSRSKDGTINLNKTQKKFTVNKGEKLELVTPTMDAGDTYEIEYR